MKNNKIKAIIFDLGGVYFNSLSTKQIISSFIKKTKLSKKVIFSLLLNIKKQKKLKKKIHDFNLGKIKENSLWKYVRNITGIKKTDKELTEIILSNYKPIKSVQNLVKRLRKKYKIALLTNNNIWLDVLNERYNFYKNFDEIISSHSVQLAKPHVRIYRLMLKKLKLKPNECIFVDDKKINVEAAVKIGMKGIVFKSYNQLRHDLESLGVSV